MDHSSYERGGVETLSMKLLEKKKKKNTLESPIGGLNVSGIHSTNQSVE
jgi:hypothetical protein